MTKNLQDAVGSKMMTWREVNQIHRSIGGVFVKNKIALSILYNSTSARKYENSFSEKMIEYRVNSNTQSRGILALIAAVEDGRRILVFEKIEKNVWRQRGYWRVKDLVEEKLSDSVVFRLIPCN